MPPKRPPLTPPGLRALTEKEFDDTLFLYLKEGGYKRKGPDQDAFRSPAVAEYTLDALQRLYSRFKAGASKPGANLLFLAKMAAAIEAERAVVKPIAGRAREERASRERGKGYVHRAYKRLADEYAARFVQLKREERDRDLALGRDPDDAPSTI